MNWLEKYKDGGKVDNTKVNKAVIDPNSQFIPFSPTGKQYPAFKAKEQAVVQKYDKYKSVPATQPLFGPLYNSDQAHAENLFTVGSIGAELPEVIGAGVKTAAKVGDNVLSNIPGYIPQYIENVNPRTLTSILDEKLTVGGKNNKGVFTIKNRDWVVKLENPNLVANSMNFPEYGQFNYAKAMQGLDEGGSYAKVKKQMNLPEKTRKQLKEKYESYLPKEGRALVMNKVKGKPLSKLTKQELENLPEEALDDVYKRGTELYERGLGVDFVGNDNFFYNPETKRFSILDISPQVPDEKSYWNNVVLGKQRGFGQNLSNTLRREYAGKMSPNVLDEAMELEELQQMNEFKGKLDNWLKKYQND